MPLDQQYSMGGAPQVHVAAPQVVQVEIHADQTPVCMRFNRRMFDEVRRRAPFGVASLLTLSQEDYRIVLQGHVSREEYSAIVRGVNDLIEENIGPLRYGEA